jgi:hypothetical protein
MARWGQARFSPDSLRTAQRVFNPVFFDRESGREKPPAAVRIAAFAGPSFEADLIEAYIDAFPVAAR